MGENKIAIHQTRENMKELFIDLLSLPYASGKKFEALVGDVIKSHGLYAQPEPNGSQNAPDWRIFVDGVEINIECKSSEGNAPTYNGGRPHKGMVYVFCSKKHNSTTIYFGDDVLGDAKRDLYDGLLKDQKEVLIKYRGKEGWLDPSRGFDFYNRAMYVQIERDHPGSVKDYFLHPDRSKCEQKVLNHEFIKRTGPILHEPDNSEEIC